MGITMNFNTLLKPYEEGGTKSQPIKRTMSTIIDYLANKKQYPLDVIGGALFLIFIWLDNDNEFKGDGSYGSKGKELVTSIRMKCDELLQFKLEAETYKIFVEMYGKEISKILKQNKSLTFNDRFINWWYGRKT